MELSDEILVRRTLDGDSSAFRMLLNRHCGVVHGLCYHLVHNFADAEDLAQEAFIKAYFKLSSLSNPTRFLSWLRQITMNVCHDWLRRQRKGIVPLESLSNQADVSSSPEAIYETKALQEKVAEAIALLSEKNRQVVTLYYLDGRSCNEVADFLDVSVSVVQSRLYEARKQLKKELIAMVEEDFESHKLMQDFDEKVMKAVARARKAQSQYVYNEAIKYCDEALDVLAKLPESVEHKKAKKEALWLKGDAFNRHTSRAEAIKYYEEALELEKEIGSKSSQANLIGEMGRHYSNVGNREKADEYYKAALQMFSELGDEAGQAKILHHLASLSIAALNAEEGISYYQRALDLFLKIGDRKEEASCRAGVSLLKNFGKQIAEMSVEGGPSRMISYGAVRETFKKLPDAVMYLGISGTLGAHIRAEKYYTIDTSPFRFCFLPGVMKFLDFSVPVGGSWSEKIPSGGPEPLKITVTIESDSETVSVPAGTFLNCLKTKIVTSEEPEERDENRYGEREFLCAPGVGLVKSTSVRRDGVVHITQLTSYTVSGGNKDYFPLTSGNKWTYEWADEKGKSPSTDIYELVGLDNDEYYISRYYCAIKQL